MKQRDADEARIQSILREEAQIKSILEQEACINREVNLSLYSAPYPTAFDRLIRDLERNGLVETGAPSSMRDLAVGSSSVPVPHVANPLGSSAQLVGKLEALYQEKSLLDVAVGSEGSEARTIRGQMDWLDQRRRYLDPLLDTNFLQCLIGRHNDDLIRRVTVSGDREALRLLREKVYSAATSRIRHQLINSSTHDAAVSSIDESTSQEAQRLLNIYGPYITELPQGLMHEGPVALYAGPRLRQLC